MAENSASSGSGAFGNQGTSDGFPGGLDSSVGQGEQNIVDTILDYATPDVTDTTLDQPTYDFTYRIFPEDLGNEDVNHYMVININVPVNSGGDSRSAFKQGVSVLQNEFSKVDTLRFGGGSSAPGQQAEGAGFTLPRSTRRIKESIALHMPNGGLVYTEDNKYQEISMTALAGDAIKGLASFVPGESATKFASLVTDGIGNAIAKGGQITGYPINPRVEVLFATRPQRQWMFEVFMMPRTQKESQTIKEIIRTLRFHAAPELDSKTFGFTFIPPAEFDITFYRNGQENLNLPRINTCVLERIDIDYAPQGDYATFRDGSPVAVRMSLGLREIELLHKRRVYEGF